MKAFFQVDDWLGDIFHAAPETNEWQPNIRMFVRGLDSTVPGTVASGMSAEMNHGRSLLIDDRMYFLETWCTDVWGGDIYIYIYIV